MTNPEKKSRKPLFGGIGLVLIVAAAAGIYMYQVEQQRQATFDAHALIDTGMAQFHAGQYELSLQTMGSIPASSLEDWHIPYYMGSAHIQLKDYETGATRLEQALALNPVEENILFGLGVAYYKLGNLSLSKAYFASVLEVNPTHEEAKGLMDIMASLERRQPAVVNEDTTLDSTGDNDH